MSCVICGLLLFLRRSLSAVCRSLCYVARCSLFVVCLFFCLLIVVDCVLSVCVGCCALCSVKFLTING